MTQPSIRPATAQDASAIAEIYRPFVEKTCVSFEEIAPDAAEIRGRLDRIGAVPLPYYVAEVGGAVVAYAYAAPFHSRAAYRHTVENSVYVSPAHARKGIGSLLMTRIIAECAALGCRQMIALIADTGLEASPDMHAGLGFTRAGRLTAVGLKFGRWIDVLLMQRALDV